MSKETQVYRMKVVSTFLKAGAPLNKVDTLCELLEENSPQLAGGRSLNDFIPFIHEQEVAQIRQEIAGEKVSAILDGTTCLGEAMVILLRFVTDDWQIQYRLVCVQMLAKLLTGEEVLRVLTTILQVHYQVGAGALLGCMRDRASVNNVALATMKAIFPNIFDAGCFSHTMDHVIDFTLPR